MSWLKYWISLAEPDAATRSAKLMQVGLESLHTGKLRTSLKAFARGYADALQCDGSPAVDLVAAYCAAHASHVAGLKGRNEVAKRWAERALEIDPDNAKAYENLGKAAVGLHDLPAARRHLMRALELNASAPEYDPGINQGIGFLVGQLLRMEDATLKTFGERLRSEMESFFMGELSREADRTRGDLAPRPGYDDSHSGM